MRVVVLAPSASTFAIALCDALAPVVEARGGELARGGTGDVVIESPPATIAVDHYKSAGVTEVWRIDPETRALEVYHLWADSYDAVGAGADGVVRTPALEIELSQVEGRLRIAWDGGVSLI